MAADRELTDVEVAFRPSGPVCAGSDAAASSPGRIVRACVRLELDDSPPDRDRDGFRPVAGSELLHDVLDVDLDRLFGDEQVLGDVPVPVPSRDLPQHLDFTHGEGLVAEVLGEVGHDLGRDPLLAGVDLADPV